MPAGPVEAHVGSREAHSVEGERLAVASLGRGAPRTPPAVDVVVSHGVDHRNARVGAQHGVVQVPLPLDARPVGDETGVTVVESGFTSLDLPETLREDARKGNKGGWQYELASLRAKAEA